MSVLLDHTVLRAQGETWFRESGAAQKRAEVAERSLRFCVGGYKVDFDEYLKSGVSAHWDAVLREQHRTIRQDVDGGRSDPDTFKPPDLAELMWFVQRERSRATLDWEAVSSNPGLPGHRRKQIRNDGTKSSSERDIPAEKVLRDHRSQISRILQAYLERNRFPGYVQVCADKMTLPSACFPSLAPPNYLFWHSPILDCGGYSFDSSPVFE